MNIQDLQWTIKTHANKDNNVMTSQLFESDNDICQVRTENQGEYMVLSAINGRDRIQREVLNIVELDSKLANYKSMEV